MDEFNEIELSSLSDEDLNELAADLADLFTEMSSAEEFSAEDATEVEVAIDKVTAELAARAEAVSKVEKLTGFASKYARTVEPVVAATEAPAEVEAAAETPAEETVEEKEATEFALPAALAKWKAAHAPKAAAKADDDSDKKEEMGTITPAGLPAVGTETLELAATGTPNAIVASADIPGFNPGQNLGDLTGTAKAVMAKRRHIRGTDEGADGYQYLVASVVGDYPEDRILDTDAHANMAKIDAVTAPKAITASGGITVPLEPYYTLNILGSGERPVKAGLPSFAAARGGIRFISPPKLTDLNGSNAIITAAQDAAGYNSDGSAGKTVFKPFIVVSTGAENDVTLYAVTRQLQFGNFGARTYPEQVEAWLNLSITHHARVAETQLLDQMKAVSTAVTAPAVYGAARTLIPQIEQAAVAYRSRHRTGDNIRFRCMLPDWSKALVRADIARQQYGSDYNVSDAQITAWFSARGINVSFYIDSASSDGQIFGVQGATALLTYPTTVSWFLFVEGTFLFLDGGTLDLGLVRDSTLNSTNDYRIFVETFEAVAFVGVESLHVTSTVVANGAAPAGVTAAAGPL